MNLQLSDIIIKNTTAGETIWISQRLIMEVCGLSETYLWKIRSVYKKSVLKCHHHLSYLPDTGKGWRWAKTDRGYFYCFDNIPDRNPTNFRSQFGTAEQIKERLNEVSGSIKITLKENIKAGIREAVKQYRNNEDANYYRYDSDVAFTDQQAQELAKSLAWCKYLKQMYFYGDFKKYGIQKKGEFIELCTEILEPLQLEGLKVSSAAYLRNKVAAFPDSIQEQRNFLISDKYNNDNARIIGKTEIYDQETGEIFKFDAHEALMFNAYMNPGGTTKEAIWALYNGYYVPGTDDFGVEPVAYRTFCHHLAKFHNQIKTARARHGIDYYKKHFLTYVPSKKLQFSHSLFAGDGSGTLNYQYTDNAGKVKTVKLYVILISDVASRKIVGWAPAPKGQHKETPEMVANAVKMAVDNCNRMTMFEFISDNHSAFTAKESKEFLNQVFNKVRTIEVGNSQANPAETEFRLFKRILRSELNFTSSSWNAGIENQSNPDHFNIDSLPNYEDAVIQFSEIVERWNARPLRDGTTPEQRFTYRNPNAMPMDERIIRKLYGNQTEKQIRGMRGFLQVEKAQGYEIREKYLFEIPDYTGTGAELLAKATNYIKDGKVKVIWDETAADIYTLDGKFVLTALPAQLASQAEIETDDYNEAALSHHSQRKAAQMKHIDEFESMLSDIWDTMPYQHEMKAGGSKETYNGKMNEKPQPENSKKHRTDRDFNEDDWK